MRNVLALLTLIFTSFHGGSVASAADRIFTLNNNPAGNGVMSFVYHNGVLTSAGTFSTGGTGVGRGLGNQGALTMTPNRRYILAVNPGSNEISSFRVVAGGLVLVDKVSSGGVLPLSVTTNGRSVYVLNGGGVNNVSGFRITTAGRLRPIPGSLRYLSADSTAPAQVGFSPDGKTIIVTEKSTNMITSFSINEDTGLAEDQFTVRAPGDTPFGFDFHSDDGSLFVSEAFGGQSSAVSSFTVFEGGALGTISSSVRAGDERAACWVKVDPFGRHAFVTNTASNTVSSYRLDEGRITLVRSHAAATGAGPTDLDMNSEGTRLFVLNAQAGTFSTFRVERGAATLTAESESGVILPQRSATGLLVR